MSVVRPAPSDSVLSSKADPAAESIVRQLIVGAIRTQALYVAAKLGVADLLALEPSSADGLAERLTVDASVLRRVLRLLVSQGVFLETADGHFALNPAAELLQTTHPRSLRQSAIRAGEGFWNISTRLLDAVRTGATPHVQAKHCEFFDHLAARGKEGEFATRMRTSMDGLGEAVARRKCFRRARRVVDIGGGCGSLLISVLEHHPHLQGVIFDRALHGASELVERAGLNDRCELVLGDFFDAAIPRGDVYLLSWILHDWSDEQARQILRNCRTACGEDAILLVLEVLLPEHASALSVLAPGLVADPFTLDMQMLLLTSGRERTLQEYRALLDAEGWQIEGTTELRSSRGVSLIEATARTI